jgi:hypothetical protein
MTVMQLNWSKLFLLTTSVFQETQDNSTLQLLQWQTSGSTLQLTRSSNQESFISVRLDQDVESIEVGVLK